MAKTSPKVLARRRRIRSIRKKIHGTAERPRLRVFRSNKHIYAQIIDDDRGVTLVSMSSKAREFAPGDAKDKSEVARQVGRQLAERAKAAGIGKVVFDRGGYLYHGRVKALSEGAREGGLEF